MAYFGCHIISVVWQLYMNLLNSITLNIKGAADARGSNCKNCIIPKTCQKNQIFHFSSFPFRFS